MKFPFSLFGKPKAGDVFSQNQLALAKAIQHDREVETRKLLREGNDPNGRGKRGMNLLQWAIFNNATQSLRALLEAGADPRPSDESGYTAVHDAARVKWDAPLTVLLDASTHAGVDTHDLVNIRQRITQTVPLHEAVRHRREKRIVSLLTAGADINLADRTGETPLLTAAASNSLNLVLLLLRAGADPTIRNNNGKSMLDLIQATPQRLLTSEAARARQTIMDWCQGHGYITP